MSDEAKLAFDRAAGGLPATVPVAVPGLGTYRVPRIYLACHTLAGADLPAVAERYGFEPCGQP